jgi:histidyl-tRNA synthetase
MTEKLNTQPYKGARDFFPEDMEIRNYIFERWKKVCKSYGYEEYDGPFLEYFDLYAAKSGEELVNEQLYSFDDKGGRKVAIRPEMTPTLARMVAQNIKALPLPIRWFSISNFWRYEKPQRGRGREFFQLNADIFGIDGIEADFEIISLMTDMMKGFGADEKMFEIRINNRRLSDDFYKSLGLDENQIKTVNKALDKRSKISKEEFEKWLSEDAGLSSEQTQKLSNYLSDPYPTLKKFTEEGSKGAGELAKITGLVKERGIEKFVKFDPSVIRGLDYYTGMVFEIYDLNEKNIRAIAGGGRYDDLVELFSTEKVTGTGFAMGDITLEDFLRTWNLLPDFKTEIEYFITVWPSDQPEYFIKSLEISDKLREKNKNVVMWLDKDTKLDKQLRYADKRNIKYTLIIGENELKKGVVTVKSMFENKQEELNLNDFLESIT